MALIGPESHGDGWKLPEIRHQPRMGVRRQTRMVAELVAEILEVFLGEASFEEGAGIHSGRSVALEVDEVACLIAITRGWIRPVKEMAWIRASARVASEAKVEMWPPIFASYLFCRTTIRDGVPAGPATT